MSSSFLTDAERALFATNQDAWLKTVTCKEDATLWSSQETMVEALMTSEGQVIVSSVARRDGATSMAAMLSAAIAGSGARVLFIALSARQAKWASDDLERVVGTSGIDTSLVTHAPVEILHGFAFPDGPPPCVIVDAPCVTGESPAADVALSLMASNPGCRVWMLKAEPATDDA